MMFFEHEPPRRYGFRRRDSRRFHNANMMFSEHEPPRCYVYNFIQLARTLGRTVTRMLRRKLRGKPEKRAPQAQPLTTPDDVAPETGAEVTLSALIFFVQFRSDDFIATSRRAILAVGRLLEDALAKAH